MTGRVLFLGGNGHTTERLEPARRAIRERALALELVELPYPGFEGRPRASSLDEFLEGATRSAASAQAELVYATGIGGLFALALRARGALEGQPLLLQGAVLWGLERRLFARVMRGPLPHLLQLAFRTPLARRRFRAKHLKTPLEPELERAFFRGYERCAAFPDFFRWLRPPFLRDLERRFAEQPRALEGIRVWWGERDSVVGLDELEVTERALGTRFPRRTFPAWGHYPMLEDAVGWVEELERALA